MVLYAGMEEWGERCEDGRGKAEMGLFAEDKECWVKRLILECSHMELSVPRKMRETWTSEIVRNTVLKLVNIR